MNAGLVAAVLVAVALVQPQQVNAQESSGKSKVQSSMGAGINSGPAVDAVKKVENDWINAMQKNDDKEVGKILVDGWIGTDPDGSIEQKPKFLSDVKSGQYATVKLDNINVTLFGSTAIATGRATDKDGKYAYTDVFIREGGKWKAVASQIAKIG
jgi:hypothetical protein